MLKQKKKITLLLVPLILVGCLYFYDASLDVYTSRNDGTLVHNNWEFKSGYETYKKFYVNGERNFEIDQLIGKTNNSKFLVFKESVWSIKGESPKEVVFVKGLMIEGVYEIKK